MEQLEFEDRLSRATLGRCYHEYLDRINELEIDEEVGKSLMINLFCTRCGSFCASSIDMRHITKEDILEPDTCGLC